MFVDIPCCRAIAEVLQYRPPSADRSGCWIKKARVEYFSRLRLIKAVKYIFLKHSNTTPFQETEVANGLSVNDILYVNTE